MKSSQGIETQTRYSFASAPQFDILMVSGGMGTRTQIYNPALLEFIQRQDRHTQWTASVCTGSALLAKAGELKQRRATSNKQAFDFAVAQDSDVLWQKNARWVFDGKYVTSSGVSAGMDMALALVEALYSRAHAERIAHGTEYLWNSDPVVDTFAT